MSANEKTSKAETELSESQTILRSATLTDSDLEAMQQALVSASSNQLAFEDEEFLSQRRLRGVRLQLEMLKPDMALREKQITSTIVCFGGTRILSESQSKIKITKLEERLHEDPENKELQRQLRVANNVLAKSHYYEEARRFSRLVSSQCQTDGKCDYVVVTGGGPGVMEAANRGAYDIGANTIGLNIVLPEEQAPNPYITPELCFQFHYFAIRKMHFMMRARALVVFPGGYGTLDELFEALTLVQTKKARSLPIILFGKDFWERIISFETLVEEGVIHPDDLKLFSYAETAEEAWDIIRKNAHPFDGEIT